MVPAVMGRLQPHFARVGTKQCLPGGISCGKDCVGKVMLK